MAAASGCREARKGAQWKKCHCKIPKRSGRQVNAGCAGNRAEFLEQQALRSLAGGNVAAALSRMGLCKDALLDAASSAGYTPQLCYRLGSVIGVQVSIQKVVSWPSMTCPTPGTSLTHCSSVRLYLLKVDF